MTSSVFGRKHYRALGQNPRGKAILSWLHGQFHGGRTLTNQQVYALHPNLRSKSDMNPVRARTPSSGMAL